MYVDKLDGTISAAYYDRRSAEFRADQDRIQTALTDIVQSGVSSLLDKWGRLGRVSENAIRAASGAVFV
jgi:hypothetical protein